MTQGNVDISAIVPHPQTGRGRLCEGAIVVGMLRGKYLAPTYIWFLTRGAHLVQNGYTWYKMDTTVSMWKVCRLRILASFPDSPALKHEHDNCRESLVFFFSYVSNAWVYLGGGGG